MAHKRFVIIGDGAAGLAAAQRLRRQHPTALLAIFTDDPSPAYYRAALTNYLLGELREDQLWAVSPDFYEAFRIRRVLSRVVGIDTDRSQIWDSMSPAPLSYDALLVASGGRPRAPSFPGAHLPGVMTLRTIQDARQVMDAVRLGTVGRAVVLGGGALGLEWAQALRERGAQVTLLERAPRLLPGALDEVASDLLAARLRQAGIEVVFGDVASQAHPGPDGRVAAVTTQAGRTFPCELLCAALGVVPCSDFVKGTRIALSPEGAVLADDRLRTSVENIWAAGDVARVSGESLQLWEPARAQARAAADNMLGRESVYAPGAHYFATRLYDLDFGRIGDIDLSSGREQLLDFPRGTGTIAYRKLVVENGRLVGALMIGERASRVRQTARHYKRLIDSALDVSSIAGRLLDRSFDFEAFFASQKIFEKPRARAPAAAKAKAATLRGTQSIALARDPGLSQRTGTMQKIAPLSGTAALPSSVPAPRKTQVLSIGLQAEAPPAPSPSLPPLEAFLETPGQRFSITGALTNLGSAPGTDITLSVPGVAGLHAQISRQEDQLYLWDAGSRTGTWLNQELIVTAQRLHHGDRVRLGSVELFLHAPSLARAAARDSEIRIQAPHLEVRSGHALGLCFVMRSDSVVIGSAPDAGIKLDELSVAPRHASLRKAGTQVLLQDLGSGFPTLVNGVPLAPHHEAPLVESSLVRLGVVDLLFTERPLLDASRVLRPRAELRVDRGPLMGQTIRLGPLTLIGSDPGSTLVVPGARPRDLEIVEHGASFWVRDLAGGGSFKSGVPLGRDPVELSNGDLLLLPGGTLLHFEEGA